MKRIAITLAIGLMMLAIGPQTARAQSYQVLPYAGPMTGLYQAPQSSRVGSGHVLQSSAGTYISSEFASCIFDAPTFSSVLGTLPSNVEAEEGLITIFGLYAFCDGTTPKITIGMSQTSKQWVLDGQVTADSCPNPASPGGCPGGQGQESPLVLSVYQNQTGIGKPPPFEEVPEEPVQPPVWNLSFSCTSGKPSYCFDGVTYNAGATALNVIDQSGVSSTGYGKAQYSLNTLPVHASKPGEFYIAAAFSDILDGTNNLTGYGNPVLDLSAANPSDFDLLDAFHWDWYATDYYTSGVYYTNQQNFTADGQIVTYNAWINPPKVIGTPVAQATPRP